MTLPFLEKLLQVLAQGGFTSTYKYAVLLGLIDLCVEAGHPPTSVTTAQLARRVVELYWPQVRPFSGKRLLNSAGKQAGIVTLVAGYVEAHGDLVSPGMAVLCDPTGFGDLLREVEWILIEYPLPRVQRVGPHHDAFIYEVNWNATVKRSTFLLGKQRRDDFDNSIRFVDGAAVELVRLAPVLVPLLRAEWTAKVSALNALAEALHRPLRSLQNGRCFYCHGSLSGGASHIDHFLPWSRYPDDGLDNLLLAHDRCNGEKLHFLADIGFGHRWRDRSLEQSARLDEIAAEARWARDWTRTRGVVASVYQAVPDGVRLWGGDGNLRRIERGAELLGPKSWSQAVFGPEQDATRTVFNYHVVCFGCGGLDASLRRDVNDKAYTVCARGCRTRLFLPRDEAVARHVGWTTVRVKLGDKLWNGWFRGGRTRWMAWHGSGVAATGASAAAEGHEQVRDGFSGQEQR